MEQSPGTSVLYGQACLYAGFLLAILIRPHGLATNNGLSYYGTFASTILPYAAGILGAAYFLVKTAMQIADAKLAILRFGLYAMAPFMVIIIITPYSAGQFVDWMHTVAGAILFIIQLCVSGWLIHELHYNLWVIVLCMIELVSGIACLLYLAPSHGLLLQFQILFQIAFGALLIYGLNLLEPRHELVKKS